jgi:hypothetical protein
MILFCQNGIILFFSAIHSIFFGLVQIKKSRNVCGIKDHFFRFGSWLVLLIFFRIDEPRILDLRFFAILLKVMDSRNWMFWFLWNSFKKDFHRILDMDFGFHRNNSILFSFHFIGKCFGFRNLDFWFGSLFYSINFLIQR